MHNYFSSKPNNDKGVVDHFNKLQTRFINEDDSVKDAYLFFHPKDQWNDQSKELAYDTIMGDEEDEEEVDSSDESETED